MSNINSMKKDIDELKTTAKNFAQKDCSSCNSALALPTIHFMCGCTYHDYCIESEGIRRCTKCADDFQNLIDMKEQYAEQAKNTEQFFKSLNTEKVKFNVIAEYFGRGLFSDIDAHLQNE